MLLAALSAFSDAGKRSYSEARKYFEINFSKAVNAKKTLFTISFYFKNLSKIRY